MCKKRLLKKFISSWQKLIDNCEKGKITKEIYYLRFHCPLNACYHIINNILLLMKTSFKTFYIYSSLKKVLFKKVFLWNSMNLTSLTLWKQVSKHALIWFFNSITHSFCSTQEHCLIILPFCDSTNSWLLCLDI